MGVRRSPLFTRSVMLKLDPAVSEEPVVVRYLQDLGRPPSSPRREGPDGMERCHPVASLPP